MTQVVWIWNTNALEVQFVAIYSWLKICLLHTVPVFKQGDSLCGSFCRMKLYLFHHYLRYGSFWFIFMWKLLSDHEVRTSSRFYFFSLKSTWPSNRNLSSLDFSRCFKWEIKVRNTSLFSIHSPIWFWLLRIFTFFFFYLILFYSVSIFISFSPYLVIVFVIKLSLQFFRTDVFSSVVTLW